MKIGLALSGGGIRGASHLGVIKALSEAGIAFSHISGVSAGAIVGTLYSSGMPPEKILDLVNNTKLMKWLQPVLGQTGLLKIDQLGRIIQAHLSETRFEDLGIPLTISATRLKDAKTVYFSKGDLLNPLMASCSIPILFRPVDVDGVSYVDGGVVNNLPIEPLLQTCDRIIGVLCNPIAEDFQGGSLKKMIERTLLIAINTNTYSRREKCDIILEPPELKSISVFNLSRSREMFNIGYEYAKGCMDEILTKLT